MPDVRGPFDPSQAQLDQYLATALWAECDVDGQPFDRDFEPDDFDGPSHIRAWDDIAKFLRLVSEQSPEAFEGLQSVDAFDRWPHDLWLSRNGHGAGFFDGPEHYGQHADTLQKIAKSLGECYVQFDGDLLTLY